MIKSIYGDESYKLNLEQWVIFGDVLRVNQPKSLQNFMSCPNLQVCRLYPKLS